MKWRNPLRTYLPAFVMMHLVSGCTAMPPESIAADTVAPPAPSATPSPSDALPSPTLPPAQSQWQASLEVSPVETGSPYASSTRLRAGWLPPGEPVDHYLLALTDDGIGKETVVRVESPADRIILDGLKSGTGYSVSLTACLDPQCTEVMIADAAASGATGEEYWRIQGEGHSYEDALKVVEEGLVLAYALRFGREAGPELAGRTGLFFNPGGGKGWNGGVLIALNNSAGTGLDALSHFSSTANGIEQSCPIGPENPVCPVPGIGTIGASQPVPLGSRPAVRLYFEATSVEEPGRPTRVYYLDSQDGYKGQDYNSGPSTRCGDGDYAPGGGCEPGLAIGVSGDAGVPDSGLVQVRQSKIGYRIRDSWLWDLRPGTFMVITGADACGATENGLFYAVWDGGQWETVKDGECARVLVPKAHGPVVVHLGGDAFKLYYEDESRGHTGKPLHVIYAGGANGTLDFEDWEPVEAAREVHFLWPDGTVLDAEEESGLGDHMIYIPEGIPGPQVMYLNLGGRDNANWDGISMGIGIAVLVNP